MKKSIRITTILLIFIMLIMLTACSRKGDGSVSAVAEQPSGSVAISMDYNQRNTYSTNQFAIWIEDLEGNFVKTVYVTSFTANGGYKKREDAIPIWVEKSHIAAASQKKIDTISGATPKSGSLMYIWNLTDENGESVAAGKYNVYVEATLYEKSRILFSTMIDTSGEDTNVIADAKYTTDLAKNEANITGVTATWKNPVD